ncbi:hypothetical protein [uncultured Nocardioides sp.]|uniref:hypothetical protein n=1 Tax=uncultured Nocardioides sp. TaxID=198441 RepID=UPI002637EAEE|nr:hypothetical protein [uncultured Nocardioides sp.]
MRPAAVAPLAVLAALLAACGTDSSSDTSGTETAAAYDAERVAPPADQRRPYSETEPERLTTEVELDGGGVMALWIDPDGFRKVWAQHSDPDDPDAWTEPVLLFEAGDGCLEVEADAAGGTVAATLDCYETDAFVQQAPDESQAAVTTDLDTWDVEFFLELYTEPVVSADGSSVDWKDSSVAWTADGGFTD